MLFTYTLKLNDEHTVVARFEAPETTRSDSYHSDAKCATGKLSMWTVHYTPIPHMCKVTDKAMLDSYLAVSNEIISKANHVKDQNKIHSITVGLADIFINEVYHLTICQASVFKVLMQHLESGQMTLDTEPDVGLFVVNFGQVLDKKD